jgi:hypothetical protein
MIADPNSSKNILQYISHETSLYRNPPIHKLQETEKTRPILNRPKFKHRTFLRNYEDKQFLCGRKI